LSTRLGRHDSKVSRRGGQEDEARGAPSVGDVLAPFLDPDLDWDSRLARVVSINAFGHVS
jgi:hypothetical protein